MSVTENIETKLRENLAPVHLEVINESYKHSVPEGSESHFKVVVVSDSFEGVPLVRRHQRVNGILADELNGAVHALSMDTLTASEWERRRGARRETPECLGGSKADKQR